MANGEEKKTFSIKTEIKSMKNNRAGTRLFDK